LDIVKSVFAEKLNTFKETVAYMKYRDDTTKYKIKLDTTATTTCTSYSDDDTGFHYGIALVKNMILLLAFDT
jgi:hypothetical protein